MKRKELDKEKNVLNEDSVLKKHTIKDTLKEMFPYVVIVLIVVLIRTFLFTPIKVNGSSMDDTLHDGDTMILNKITMRFNELERFEIVVIDTGDTYLIKRIIGLPGETIEYKDGILYINDKKFEDPYYKDENTDDFEKVTVPENYYYVMGDNRSVSIDSRLIGVVSREDILGTTNLILFPFSDIGIVD